MAWTCITKDGNKPAKSKVDGLERLKDNPPKKVTDIRSLIGLTGWYRPFVPNFELRVQKLQAVIKACKSREDSQGDLKTIGDLWTPEHQEIVNDIVDEIQSRPILQRPNADMRFYLKTDWSSRGYAYCLCQPDPAHKPSMQAMRQEIQGGQCEFDKETTKLRLHPIRFGSKETPPSGRSDHSYVGEAKAGDWAMFKECRYLIGQEFTWLCDCDGLKRFNDPRTEDPHTHVLQRL